MRIVSLTSDEKNLLKELLGSPIAEGMDLAELRLVLKVLDRLEGDVDSLTLEESEHAMVLKRYQKTKFVKPDRFILQAYDKLVNAPAS